MFIKSKYQFNRIVFKKFTRSSIILEKEDKKYGRVIVPLLLKEK